jgi:hypothetical protein
MAIPTINGVPLLKAQITEPLSGRWTAYVEADTQEALTDPITLDFEDSAVEFVGAAHASGVESGRWIARLVAGTGGLSTSVEPKAYRTCPLSLALDDLLSETGETLSDDSETLSGYIVAHWQRFRGAAAHALAMIADETGYEWRLDRAGELWLGTDTWTTLEADHTEVRAYPDLRIVVIAPDAEPLVRPAVTFEGQRVDHVITRLDSDSLRQEVWFAEPS